MSVFVYVSVYLSNYALINALFKRSDTNYPGLEFSIHIFLEKKKCLSSTELKYEIKQREKNRKYCYKFTGLQQSGNIFFFKLSSGHKVMFKLSVLRRVHHLIETIVIWWSSLDNLPELFLSSFYMRSRFFLPN